MFSQSNNHGPHLQENGSKHGNGSGATPKKPAKGVSFAEHLVLTGDSLNSHGSIPEEGPGHEEVPPGDPSSAGVPLHQVCLTPRGFNLHLGCPIHVGRSVSLGHPSHTWFCKATPTNFSGVGPPMC